MEISQAFAPGKSLYAITRRTVESGGIVLSFLPKALLRRDDTIE
jgi:hypothetical protein